MYRMLSGAWRMIALRAVIAIVFGVLALAWPGLTLLALAALFAAYALLSGLALLAAAFTARRAHGDWWVLLMIGLVGICAGIITLVHPGLTALLLVLVMGANAMVSGVLELAAAIRAHREQRQEGFLILNGIVSIVFGVLVFLFPAAGALALVWLISLYAIVTGILMLAFALRVRSRLRREPGVERRVTPDRRVAGHPRPAAG